MKMKGNAELKSLARLLDAQGQKAEADLLRRRLLERLIRENDEQDKRKKG